MDKQQTDYETRMDIIGQNGNDGAAYDAANIAVDLAIRDALRAKRTAVPGYEKLEQVLREAFEQASAGKGAERHATGQPFEHQPMQKLIDLYGPGFALGQAGKKMQESQRMDYAAAKRELLGAIVYIAGAIVHMDSRNG